MLMPLRNPPRPGLPLNVLSLKLLLESEGAATQVLLLLYDDHTSPLSHLYCEIKARYTGSYDNYIIRSRTHLCHVKTCFYWESFTRRVAFRGSKYVLTRATITIAPSMTPIFFVESPFIPA